MKKRSIGYVFLMMLLAVLGANVGYVKTYAACDHTEVEYIEAKSPYIDNDGNEVDGNIEYWHCKVCDKYASDENFDNIISIEKTKDPFVKEQLDSLELGQDDLSLSDIVADPSKVIKVYTEQKIPSYMTFGEVDDKTADRGNVSVVATKKGTKYYKNTLKPFTFYIVTGNGEPKNTHKITVKFKLPEPTVTVKKKWNGNKCYFTFKYNIKGATKIKVRLWNGKTNKEIKNKGANEIFDKYMKKKSKSDKDSYIWFSKSYLNKNKNLNFKFTAYYSKNSVSTIVEP